MTTSKCLVMTNGTEFWMKNKNLHREDGPAVVRVKDNYAAYYINGRPVNFKEWFETVGHKHIKGKNLTLFLLKYKTRQQDDF